MTQRVCLVHYHEIGLKGKNRSRFENKLVNNIQKALKNYPHALVKRISGHILIFDETAEDMYPLARAIACVPGVAKVSLAFKCEQTEENLQNCCIAALREVESFETFKVHARRSNTKFPLHTLELHQLCGSALCKAFDGEGKRVEMYGPDVTVQVHLIQDDAYIWADGIEGVGGLPVGTAGKVVSLLSSGFDSPVSTWMIGRRGAVCVPIHFSGRPVVADDSEYLCQDICEALRPYGMIGRLYVAPIGEFQKQIALQVPQQLRIIMYRRLMYAVAQRVAELEGARAICVGESLGQVASQTLENIAAVNDAVDIPVLRPLIGTDKTEIIKRAQEIGTYDICCQTAPDCCTLFMPRRPETKARLEVVRNVWNLFDAQKMIDEIVENIEYIDYDCPSYKPPQKLWRRHDTLQVAEWAEEAPADVIPDSE